MDGGNTIKGDADDYRQVVRRSLKCWNWLILFKYKFGMLADWLELGDSNFLSRTVNIHSEFEYNTFHPGTGTARGCGYRKNFLIYVFQTVISVMSGMS